MMFEEYRDRVGELITGIVQQSDSRYTLVQLRERVEALLPKSEQVEGERYDHSQRIKAVIKDVSNSTKGPSIIVSRRDPELIKSLFELEVPEIADGLVEITGVAREPGYRSKIAVVSHVDGVDPVGACVGPRGSRVRMVVSELRGEKIDIIPYNDEPARFVAKALSPARVREVLVDDANKQATVIVPDDQLSLAIGREGQNARLAARLTGWRIDIRSETEFAAEEAEHGYEQEEAQGRCAAILSNGRRCPNAALPGSRYCGIEAHQALAIRTPTRSRARRGAGGAAPTSSGEPSSTAGRRRARAGASARASADARPRSDESPAPAGGPTPHDAGEPERARPAPADASSRPTLDIDEEARTRDRQGAWTAGQGGARAAARGRASRSRRPPRASRTRSRCGRWRRRRRSAPPTPSRRPRTAPQAAQPLRRRESADAPPPASTAPRARPGETSDARGRGRRRERRPSTSAPRATRCRASARPARPAAAAAS